MSTEIEIAGMQELLEKINQLGKVGKKIQGNAITKAAQPILKEAVSNAPVSQKGGKHARELLKISRPKFKGSTQYVLIGLGKDDISEAFYLKFTEWGTSTHTVRASKGNKVAGTILKSTKKKPLLIPAIAAKPFMQPAYERNKKQAIEIIKEEFKKGLGLK